jgi:hypothetical protein
MKTNRKSLKYALGLGILGALSLASLGFAAKPAYMPDPCKDPAGWNACVDTNCAGLHGKAANVCIFQCSKAFCF